MEDDDVFWDLVPWTICAFLVAGLIIITCPRCSIRIDSKTTQGEPYSPSNE